MDELRPCIVRIKEESQTARFRDGKMKKKVIREAEEHRGFFHKWSERFWVVGESPLVGGHSAGQMSQTVGIVEYEDGSVHEHYPSEIQFTDRLN